MRKIFHSKKDEKEKIPGYFTADYSFSQLASALAVGTIIPKLTAYYDLPLALSNLIVGIPTSLGFMQIFGGYYYNQSKDKLKFIRTTASIWRLIIPFVFFSVLLPNALGAVCFVACFLIMWIFQHLGGSGYNSYLVSSTTGLIKTNYYSMRDMMFIPCYTVMLLVAGLLIDNTESSGNLKLGFIVFGVAMLIFSLLSMPYLFKFLPKIENKNEAPKISFLKSITLPLKDKPYRYVLAFHVCWNFFSVFWGNFGSIYQVRILELNYMFITICMTAASVLRIVCIPLFAKFADRFSWKVATIVSYGIMFCHLIVWTFVTKENAYILYPIVVVLGTIPWAALGIGMFKFQIANTKEETRSTYFSVNSTLCGLTAAFAGICSSATLAVLENSFENPPYYIIFIIGAAGLVFTSTFIFKAHYEEPNKS